AGDEESRRLRRGPPPEGHGLSARAGVDPGRRRGRGDADPPEHGPARPEDPPPEPRRLFLAPVSYILDALRKAEQRRRRPARVPTLATVHRARATDRRWPWIAAAALVVVNVAVLAWLLRPAPSTRELTAAAPSAPVAPPIPPPPAAPAAPPAARAPPAPGAPAGPAPAPPPTPATPAPRAARGKAPVAADRPRRATDGSRAARSPTAGAQGRHTGARGQAADAGGAEAPGL